MQSAPPPSVIVMATIVNSSKVRDKRQTPPTAKEAAFNYHLLHKLNEMSHMQWTRGAEGEGTKQQ